MFLFPDTLDDALQDFAEEFQNLALTSNIPDIKFNLSRLVQAIMDASDKPVTGSYDIIIDTNNDSTTERFRVSHDSEDPLTSTTLMVVNEQAELILEGDYVGSLLGTRIRSRVANGSSATALELAADSNIDANGSRLFRVISGMTERLALWHGDAASGANDVQLFTIKRENGSVALEANLTDNVLDSPDGLTISAGGATGGSLEIDPSGQVLLYSNPTGTQIVLDPTGVIYYQSGVADGASSIAHSFDTVNNLVTSGARIFSVREVGSDVWYIDKDRNQHFNENQIQDVRLENLALDPSVGNIGRVWYDTALSHIKYDTGALVKTVATLDDLDVENLWDRTGTTLIPHFANDNINIGTGTITANGGLVTSGLVDGRDVSNDGISLDDLIALSGVAANSIDLGTFTGSTITDANTIKGALQDLETEVELKANSTVVAEIDQNVDDLITLSGVAENATNLGTFTGSTIPDASTIKGALQSLETEVELKADSTVVAEIDQNVDDLITLSGVAENATNLGAFTGSTIPDNVAVKPALQSLETEVELKADSTVVAEIDQNVDDLITLSGVAENATNLGTFTGSTISDNDTVKAALQELETEVELKADSTVVAEIDQNVDDLITLSGVAENATNLGAFTGITIPDNVAVKPALQSLETSLEEIDQNVDDLITLSGVAENATNLGTFTGTIIPDNVSVKAALQSLENSIEGENLWDRSGTTLTQHFANDDLNLGTGSLLAVKDITMSGTLTGGSSPFSIRSVESDGASAIGFNFNTVNSLITDGSRLLSLKNNSVELFDYRRGTDLFGDTDVSIFEQRYTDGTLGHQTSEDVAISRMLIGTDRLYQIRTNSDWTYGPSYRESVLQLAPSDSGFPSAAWLLNSTGIAASFYLDIDPAFPLLSLWYNSASPIWGVDNIGQNIGPGLFKSTIVDSGSAIGYKLDTVHSLVTGGAKLFTLRNNTVEKYYVGKDGDGWFADILTVNGNGGSSGGGILSIGNNTNATQGIRFKTDASVFGRGIIDMNSGKARIDLEEQLTTSRVAINPQMLVPAGNKVFSVLNNGGASELLNVYGNGDTEIFGALIGGSSPFIIKSKESDGASAIGFSFRTNNNLTTSGAKYFEIINNASAVVQFTPISALSQVQLTLGTGGSAVQARGAILLKGRTDLGEGIGTLGMFTLGGVPQLQLEANTNQLRFHASPTDSSTAIAFLFDNYGGLSTAGAKLLSLQNSHVEKFAVDKDGRLSGVGIPFLSVLPSEGSAGIQAAGDTLSASGGGEIQLFAGVYSMSTAVTSTTWDNVTIRGVGDATILQHDNTNSASSIINLLAQTSGSHNANNFTAGDTSFITTTASDATNYLVGDIVTFRYLDINGFEDYEMNEVAINGNGTTGVVGLKYKVQRTGTTVQSGRSRHGFNNKIKNLKMTFTGTNNFGAISARYQKDLVLEDITVIGGDASNSGQISLDGAAGLHGWRNSIKNCRVYDSNYEGIGVQQQNDGAVEYCKVINVNKLGNSFKGAFKVAFESRDCLFLGNTARDCIDGKAFLDTGTQTRRTKIINNTFANIYRGGVACANAQIIGNTIEDCGQSVAFDSSFSPGVIVAEGNIDQSVVSKNIITNCYYAIGVNFNTAKTVVSGNIVDRTRQTATEAFSIDSDYCVVTDNVLTNVANIGIFVGRQGCVVKGNIVTGAGSHGFEFGSGSYATVIGNVAIGNAGNQIKVDNTMTNSKFIGNSLGGGVITEGTGAGNVFDGNE